MIDIKKLENILIDLWQGKDIDVEELTGIVNEDIEIIFDSVSNLRRIGVEFPLEYITTAMKNMAVAIEKKDDYLLADNICHEWIEIFMVFNETVFEYGE